MNFQTVPELFLKTLESHQNPSAFNYLENKKWVSISHANAGESVLKIALGLKKIGVKKGSTVGIVAESSPQWLLFDLAVSFLGAVTVPMFANLSNENMDFQIKNSRIKFLFIASNEKWQLLKNKVSIFNQVITYQINTKAKNTVSLSKLLSEPIKVNMVGEFKKMVTKIKPNNLVTIIYTSGSTGLPKGVEITHQNICSQVKGCQKSFMIDAQKDLVLSCLPLAHIFQRMVTYFFVTTGVSLYYADDIQNLGPLMRSLKPTTMTVVPRLLEKVYAKIFDGIQMAPTPRRILGNLALKRAKSKAIDTPESFIDKFFKALVYKKFVSATGGNFSLMVSGGAALSDDLYRFFINIGIPLYQGYGLTETSPVISTNTPKNNRVGTVGKPFPGVKVKIHTDGEIWTKGENIMQGYHRNKKETETVINKTGWLQTGDLGSLDQDGFLMITGRKKEMLKTSNGKYISPIPLEQRLTEHELIDMALVIGEGRQFVSCLLFFNADDFKKLKNKYQSSAKTISQFYREVVIQKKISNHIVTINKQQNQWEKIVKFTVIDTPLTIEGGHLTPKMNIKRSVVEQEFANAIDKMYS